MMKFLFGMHINNEMFHKLMPLFWVCETRHAQSTQNVCISLQYLQKSVADEVAFLLAGKHVSFLYKMVVSFWVCVTRYAQSTQNNKFAISLQYLKEILKNEVDFLPADKR